jgi:hypothetical protein
MRTTPSARQFALFVLLALLLLTAVTPGAFGLFCAALVPAWVFSAVIVLNPQRDEAENTAVPTSPFLTVLSPRPPPVL